MFGTNWVLPGQGNTIAELIRFIDSVNWTNSPARRFAELVLSRLKSKQDTFKTKIIANGPLSSHDLARISSELENAPSK